MEDFQNTTNVGAGTYTLQAMASLIYWVGVRVGGSDQRNWHLREMGPKDAVVI